MVDNSADVNLQNQFNNYKKLKRIRDGKFTIKNNNKKTQGFIATSLYAAKKFCKSN